MNDRKQQVLNKAHELFIEKGFQATSIQDILEYSSISKGTFYNYFSSKNELLIAIFKNVFKQVEQGRKELLIGHDPSDIEIFIKQIEFQLKTNYENKLISLFEEVYFSKDEEIKQYIKIGNFRSLQWLYERFIDLFGESKQPYLLDCAIMFSSTLQHLLKYSHFAYGSDKNITKIVRYCINRVEKVIEDVANTGEQLLKPELLEIWLPDCKCKEQSIQKKLYPIMSALKKALDHQTVQEKSKCMELLDFIQDELLDSNNPRKFLIESALLSLKSGCKNNELKKLEQMIQEYFTD